MATLQSYRTARTPKDSYDYPRCTRGIQPGERYQRAVATPHDDEVNQGPHWWVLNICQEHMQPEPPGPAPRTRRNHCGECHAFVREDTIEVYHSIEEGCEIGYGECTRCGRVEVYLDRWRIEGAA